MKDKCIACAIISEEPELHPLPFCPNMRERCQRCFELGHLVGVCSLSKEMTRTKGTSCCICGFNHGEARNSECDRMLEKITGIVLGLFSFKRGWVNSRFPQCTLFKSKEQYVEWLFEKDKALALTNIMVVCEKWWNQG